MKRKIPAKIIRNIAINMLKHLISNKTSQQIRKEQIYRDLIKAIPKNSIK